MSRFTTLLPPSQVDEIKRLLHIGMSDTEIAKLVHLRTSTIRSIRLKKSHVSPDDPLWAPPLRSRDIQD